MRTCVRMGTRDDAILYAGIMQHDENMLLARKVAPFIPTSTSKSTRYVMTVRDRTTTLEFDVAVSKGDPINIAVGPSSKRPCVLLIAHNGGDELNLERVGFDPGCCNGGKMLRGENGTVLMLRAALKFAMQEAAPGRTSAQLMDISNRMPNDSASERCKLSCSDVHILKDPEMRTWYEKHLHATVGQHKQAALASVRAALSASVGTYTEVAFIEQCMKGAKIGGCWTWMCRPGRKEALRAVFREAAAGSWADLLRSMIGKLSPTEGDEDGDSVDCPFVLKLLAAVLAMGEVCPGWATTMGWVWSIAEGTVADYPLDVNWRVR